MTQRALLTATVITLCAAFAGEAAAQSSDDYPLRLVSRPQTVPQNAAHLDAQLYTTSVLVCVGAELRPPCSPVSAWYLNLGGGFGLTRELEVGVTVVPLQYIANVEVNDPSLYGRYQFFNAHGVQASAQLTAWIPIRSGTSFAFNAALPVWVNLTDRLQLQTGLSYSLTLSDPISHSLAIPLLVNLNIVDAVHVGLRTGVNLPFKDTGDTMSVPLGFEVGYAVRGSSNRPLLDLLAQLSFPRFLAPGSSGDVVITDPWVASLTARFYLFM